MNGNWTLDECETTSWQENDSKFDSFLPKRLIVTTYLFSRENLFPILSHPIKKYNTIRHV